MHRYLATLCLTAGLGFATANSAAADPTSRFLQTAFGTIPQPQVVWMNNELQDLARRILGHPYGALRLRYWRHNTRTAWILDEIGKEQPITTGILVNDGAIEDIRVLVYRESRGGEVRQHFFTDQFEGARLKKSSALDRPIDGISGATLSVRALTRLARLALSLHQHVTQPHGRR